MFIVQPLGKLLNFIEEDVLMSSFQNFSTKKDTDISNFLKTLAIEYEKKDIARTFLIFNDEYKGRVLAYFTIGLNVLKINDSVGIEDAYEGINLYQDGFHPIYKLFMVGKDDNCPVDFSIKRDIFDREILGILKKTKNYVGTNLVYLDCIGELLNYYKSLGFTSFGYNKKFKLFHLICSI